MLSQGVVKAIARPLIIVFALLVIDTPARADRFNNAVGAGKAAGGTSKDKYNPRNLNQTLQDKGLGTANTLTPKASQAGQQRGGYEGYYTNPGGMTGAASSDLGNFVKDSFQTRMQYDLSSNPVFGNKCLQTGADGKCQKWSGSKDLITNAYPDCEKVVIPEYDDPPTEAFCSGSRGTQEFSCNVRSLIRIETEVINTPCGQTEIGYKPGQIYAVCRDYSQYYKTYMGQQWIRNDCHCLNNSGAWCSDFPSDFILGAAPPDASYVASTYEIVDCHHRWSIWGPAIDDGLTNIYNWYVKYRNSVIERVYLDYDSPCGDVSRFLNECSVKKFEQCDPNGQNCIVAVSDGEPTGQVASTNYLTYTQDMPLLGACNSCSSVCLEYDWEGNCVGPLVFTCGPPTPSGCVGACPPVAVPVSAPSNSAVPIGTQFAYDGGNYVAGCITWYEDAPVFHPNNSFPVSRKVFYRDPRVCGSYAGSIENYLICMNGTSMTLQHGAATPATLTQTQVLQSSFVWEHKLNINYIRAYGGPDVQPLLKDWYVKLTFGCNQAADNCQSLRDQGCVLYNQRCIDQSCLQMDFTYRCGGTGGVKGYQVAYTCAGNIRCMGSDCVDLSYQANTDFRKIPEIAEVMNSIRADGTDSRIFPGKAMECQTSPRSCCNPNTGGVSIADYVSAAYAGSKLYSLASTGLAATANATAAGIATTANTLATSVGLAQPAVLSTTAAGATTTTVTATTTWAGTTATVTTATTTAATGGAVGTVTTTAATAGAAGSTLVTSVATFAAVAGAIIAAYVIAMMLYEMAFACNDEDIKTSIGLGFNLCQQVGTRCSSNFLGVCIKRRAVYCCFNSILARLIHQQGRPQIGKSWGTNANPACEGFAYGEFEALDFARIDLREYMQYIQQTTQIPPDKAQAIMQRVQQKYP